MVYQLKSEQFLPISLTEAWAFFSSPSNLSLITPDYLGFEIISPLPEEMYEGMIIMYFVKPVLNLKMRWVTEITHIDDKKYFVDEQRSGPYKLWHHEHIFKEVEGGVLMTDIVTYQLPFSFLGHIAHSLFIKRQLNGIFKYRKEFLNQYFKK